MAASDASYFMPYQYGNQANPAAHYNGTAPEILEELDEISAFVAGLGTGGTLMGVGRRLRRSSERPCASSPPSRCRASRAGAALARRRIHPADHRPGPARPQDLRHQPRRDHLDAPAAEEEGIFAGVSSGAIASIAVRIANELDEGNVVFVVCDDGWKYLSSGIYTQPVDEIADLDSTVWW